MYTEMLYAGLLGATTKQCHQPIFSHPVEWLRKLAHRLRRSKLRPSLLRTLLTTPSLKNFSSPRAVLPPMYHLSAPMTSLNPSLELSLPRRREGACIGMLAVRLVLLCV